MKNPRTGRNLFLLIMSFLTLFIFFNKTNSVQAVPSTEDVYKNAPRGMKLDNDYLEWKDTFSGNVPFTNSLTPILRKNNPGNPTDIMQLISDKNPTQLGSFWGTVKKGTDGEKTYNYFDVTKKQIVSAWVYVGNSSEDTADGWTFVLQNDDNGTDAIARDYNKSPNPGESLGVWGEYGKFGFPTSPYNPERLGIQNSFVIEFDSVMNDSYATKIVDNSLDAGTVASLNDVKKSHIAGGLPGSASSYVLRQQTVSGDHIWSPDQTHYETYLQHQTPIQKGYVAAGYDQEVESAPNAWRHAVFTYTPPAESGKDASLTYLFNDKYSDGTQKSFSLQDSRTYSFNPETTFGKDVKRVRWGFTASNGSTGSKPQTLAVVMESMPSIADVTANVVLTDKTQNREIPDMAKDSSADGKVNNGDNLGLEYSLKYNSGFAETGDIATQVGLPQNVDYKADSDGNIGTITYSVKGQDDVTEPIKASQLVDGTNHDNQKIKVIDLTLKSLSNDSVVSAKININGVAAAPETSDSKTIAVKREHTSYQSDNYNFDVMTPEFRINNDTLQIKTSSSNKQTIDYKGGVVDIDGIAEYLRGTKFSGDSVSVHVQIDDNPKDYISTVGITSGGSTTNFSDTDITGVLLKPGEHTLKVYVVDDSTHHISNIIEYKVTVNDYKKLLLTADANNLKQSVSLTAIGKQYSGELEYNNEEKIYGHTITLHWNIDGEESTEELNGSDPVDSLKFNKPIEPKALGVGVHKVTVYADDSVRKSEPLNYTINVTDRALIATPDPDKEEIDVLDNNPVQISGTYDYSDKTDVTNVKVSYTIKNGDSDAQNPVTIENDGSGNFKFNVNPLLLDATEDGGSFDSAEKALGDPTTPGLRVGRNEVTVTIKDYDNSLNPQLIAESTPIVYIINVPDMSVKLSTKSPSITTRSTSQINFPATLEYSNSDYKLNPNGLKKYYKASDSDKWEKDGRKDIEPSGTTPLDFSGNSSGSNIGINSTDPAPHKVDSIVMDLYGRKSNPIQYTVTVVTKEMKLTVGDYKFQTINYGQSQSSQGLIQRQGDWDIDVMSYRAKWNLYAEQTGNFTQTMSDGSTANMRANMIFIDKNKNSSALSAGETYISSGSASGTTENNVDVSDTWSPDDGILLAINGYNTAGNYQGEITWSLVDSDS